MPILRRSLLARQAKQSRFNTPNSEYLKAAKELFDQSLEKAKLVDFNHPPDEQPCASSQLTCSAKEDVNANFLLKPLTNATETVLITCPTPLWLKL